MWPPFWQQSPNFRGNVLPGCSNSLPVPPYSNGEISLTSAEMRGLARTLIGLARLLQYLLQPTLYIPTEQTGP